MKLTVIGGGGVRSMFLAKSIAQKASQLGINKLVFMDNDEEKLRIYAGMAKHVAKLLCPELDFTLTTNAVEAVRDADYVITTIRVGGDSMRVCDERIALSLGILGQETTGAAGFSFAMRSIPALAEYCELIKKHSKPDVKVFNFTNPAGLVSQALRDMGYDFTYGVCDAPSGMLHSFSKLYGVEPEAVKGELFGLNHLSYFDRIMLNGKNIVGELAENHLAYKDTDMRYFEKKLVRELGYIPNEYLYYFYYREKAVANILAADLTRGEQIELINTRMTAQLRDMDVENSFEDCLAVFEKYYGMRENSYMASETGVKRENAWHFDPYSKDSGGYAGVALKYIEIMQSGKSDSMILCTTNNGAIEGLLDSDVVEITCDINPDGCCVPHKFTNIKPECFELIKRMKLYERDAAKAIVARNKKVAVSALMLHPLVNSYSLACQLVKEYVELNADFSGGWQ